VTRPARAFQITVWLGIAVNFAIALAALVDPDWLLRTLGYQTADPNIWPRFAALLLMLLSLFYIPGAQDLDRYRANAVLAVVARVAGVIFFTGAVVLLDFAARYFIFGLIDLVFAVPSGAFLWAAMRRPRHAVGAP
jgi:hypothetical protein